MNMLAVREGETADHIIQPARASWTGQRDAAICSLSRPARSSPRLAAPAWLLQQLVQLAELDRLDEEVVDPGAQGVLLRLCAGEARQRDDDRGGPDVCLCFEGADLSRRREPIHYTGGGGVSGLCLLFLRYTVDGKKDWK